MRRVSLGLAAVLLGVPLALGVGGCKALDDQGAGSGAVTPPSLTKASEAGNKVKICAQALVASNFSPVQSSPERSAREAGDSARELGELAGKASDPQLQQALREMAQAYTDVSEGRVQPKDYGEWNKVKFDQANRLRKACLGHSN
ncbi:hypothetical protein LX15_002756 [Streptoalloteichus tenebrarius]|uniref:Lipoprotein n=1 Tax=Streptoalloteichus tenebrarius (strain ATCC 17920 / DSM 40477 / JCM 4838 / CBS 697.72 / NBRC 16177 / NCIMB 11028 / NRRL B-12390 / A12253. 1 / ISP 5477) TaxID=1933 RepID=A0ABT1HUF3_STRSD|nr:hypothetical protein [Streptoalloteichus tenebrarius]MCP2259055.1 hypothetical protein [Streptoalloteichus tenebrarius]BFE99619.1 hypothetical protein GCM10020241_12950 [Streptoalloteichus tenebrarius]